MRLLHVVGARPNLPEARPRVSRPRPRGVRRRSWCIPGSTTTTRCRRRSSATSSCRRPTSISMSGSHTHAVQTARILERLEPVVMAEQPGLGGGLRRRELDPGRGAGGGQAGRSESRMSRRGCGAATAHAGGDQPDHCRPAGVARCSRPSRDADETLRREGEPADEIVFVGNVMIDSVLHALAAGAGAGAAVARPRRGRWW